jgi:hypothetical protein
MGKLLAGFTYLSRLLGRIDSMRQQLTGR